MIIRNEQNKLQAIEQVRGLQDDVEWEVTIKEYKENRTNAQNNLMWMWHKVFAEKYGETKERVHHRFKYKYVIPILLREDREGKLTKLYGLAESDKDAMAALVRVISTTHLNTAELSEALTEYDRESSANGIAFPHPDIYHLAIR